MRTSPQVVSSTMSCTVSSSVLLSLPMSRRKVPSHFEYRKENGGSREQGHRAVGTARRLQDIGRTQTGKKNHQQVRRHDDQEQPRRPGEALDIILFWPSAWNRFGSTNIYSLESRYRIMRRGNVTTVWLSTLCVWFVFSASAFFKHLANTRFDFVERQSGVYLTFFQEL